MNSLDVACFQAWLHARSAPAQQQAPAAVTLVVGEEEFLVDRAVRERIAAARASGRG